MKIHFGFKIAGIAAALALAGCMTGQDTASEKARADAADFVNTSATSLAKITFEGEMDSTFDFGALGCPKLNKLIEDMATVDEEGELPQSFIDYLACLGLSPTPTQEELEGIEEKLQDITAILDCLCGNTSLSDLYNKDYLKWSTFTGTTSAAASSFDGKSSAGTTFDGKSSVAGSGFDGKSSVGTTFDGK